MKGKHQKISKHYEQDCSILTSIPKASLISAQNHSRRPNICTTENYLENDNPPTVPGNSSYATVSKFGNKIFLVGKSHVNRIKRLDFNKQMISGKAFFASFSGANSRQLDHYNSYSCRQQTCCCSHACWYK